MGLPGTEPTGYVLSLTLILFGTKEDPLARNQHIDTRRKEVGKVDIEQRKQGTLHGQILFVCNQIFECFYGFGIAALPETRYCWPVSSLQMQFLSLSCYLRISFHRHGRCTCFHCCARDDFFVWNTSKNFAGSLAENTSFNPYQCRKFPSRKVWTSLSVSDTNFSVF